MSTYRIVHDLPGRMRIRYGYYAFDPITAEGLRCEIATWTKPKGGYFISLHVENNCAKKVVKMCKEAGMVLTGAGATFPYHIDPYDSVIRISPSYPTPEELKEASHVLAVCTKIATLEKELG